jgi:hypothetical protein
VGSQPELPLLIFLQTLHRLEQIFRVQVKFSRNEQAVGYGPANDAGIRRASGKYVALINSDMWVLPVKKAAPAGVTYAHASVSVS